MSTLPEREGRVLVVGDVMTDIVVRADGPLVRGSDRSAAISVVDGGSAANQASWLAAAGVPSALFARVGAADLVEISTRLRAEGIEPMLAGDATLQSGRLVTIVHPDGERSFYTDRGANVALAFADLPEDWRLNTRLVILSGYSFFAEGPRACMGEIMAAAGAARIPVVVDAASAGFIAEAGPSAFLDWTKGAAIIVVNGDEAALLTGANDIEDQVYALLEVFPTVVIKRGAHGSVACKRSERPIFVPGLPTDVVDSSGAGDAFLGGCIARWRQGGDMASCLAEGNRFGAEAVRQVGGRPPHRFGEVTWS